MSDVYSQILFNRTCEDVTQFEVKRGKPPFTPTWILKITWDHVLPISYQKINLSEVSKRLPLECTIHYNCVSLKGQFLDIFMW